MEGKAGDELFRVVRDILVDLFRLRAKVQDGWIGRNRDALISGDGAFRGQDERGWREISEAMERIDNAVVAPRRQTPIADLSHLPPLDEVVDGGLRRDFDDHDLKAAFRGLERQYGPYRVEIMSAGHEESWIDDDGIRHPAAVAFAAKVLDANGADAGALIYNFYRDSAGKLVATNELTILNEEFRGRGFSTAFSASIEGYFRSSGVDRILLHAEMADGGAAWAKAGYDWDDDPHNLAESVYSVRTRIDKFLDGGHGPISAGDAALLREMRARFDGPAAGFPSPQELVMLAGDNSKLGDDLMRGSQWYGMKKL